MNLQFVVWVIDQLAAMLEPLRGALETEATFSAYMKRFGWVLDPNSFSVSNVNTTIGIANDVATVATDIATLLSASGQDPDVTAIVNLVEALVKIVDDIRKIDANAPPAQVPAGLWSDVAPQMADDLLLQYLEGFRPGVYGILLLLGGVSEKSVSMTGVANRADFTQRSIDLGGVLSGIENPAALIRKTIGWTPPGTLDAEKLLSSLGKVLALTSLPAQVKPAKPALVGHYFAPGNPKRAQALELDIPVIRAQADDGSVLFEAALSFMPIPPDPASLADPDGVAIALSVASMGAAGVPEAADWPFNVELEEEFAADDGIRLEIHPGSVRLTVGGTANIKASASIEPASNKPLLIAGTWGSNALILGHWKASLGAFGPITAPDIQVGLVLTQLELIIDFGDSDGFIQQLMGGNPVSITADLELVWSSRTGFGFKGQATVEATIPLHLNLLDVIELDSLYLALRLSTASAAAIVIAISGGLNLGPLAASVDRIGIEARLKPKAGPSSGPLGNLEASFGFKSPNGLGLVIDAGPIGGGGYIFCDPDKGEYAGVLELEAEVVQIKVIGILNTILPGGQPGFSLLLIVSAEFEPIQLGFGFTLNGVGGLAGINRTMILDALRAGLKNHNLNSILFPTDPVAHAQQIISDLQTVFPPQLNRYVFGPMLELGWGVPSLIIAELGVVLELPAPIRLAILGRMTAVLPDEDAAVVVIHLDVLGTVDFEKKYLTIDATLYDSRVVAFTLLGDMALRLLWGENANFALSVGGLNPRSQPPPGFPTLARLSLSLGDGDNPRLSCDAYFAVTSNTLQFGAGISLHAAAAGFSVDGYLGFDALFVVSPFHFIVELKGSVDLKHGGTSLMSVSLDLELDGPNPWHVSGTASAHILFITVSVSFDHSFGDPNQVTLPAEDPTPKLLTALNDVRSWNAALPADAERAVSLLAPRPDDKTVLLHPLGRLGVTQKVLPLGLRMARFGSAAPQGVDQFDLKDITVNGQSLRAADFVTIADNFAPGQFLELSDDEKLSRPPFEPHTAGVELTANDVVSGTVQALDVEYETILVDDPHWPGMPAAKYGIAADRLLAQAGQGAARFSPLRNTGRRKFLDPQAPDGTVSVGHTTYRVTTTDDLSPRDDISDAGSFSVVQQNLEAHLAQHPEQRDSLQIRPEHETVAV